MVTMCPHQGHCLVGCPSLRELAVGAWVTETMETVVCGVERVSYLVESVS